MKYLVVKKRNSRKKDVFGPMDLVKAQERWYGLFLKWEGVVYIRPEFDGNSLNLCWWCRRNLL